ncbi:MAG: hypothetical protein K2X03_22195 [Bryobacteraceae bacterium]|nr:hypothetical protein [Bryobacteraceae bacterium]
MKLLQILTLGLILEGAATAVTSANMGPAVDVGIGVFDITVNGVVRRLYCLQFNPPVSGVPYTANVYTLTDLQNSLVGTAFQGDPQGLLKYRQIAVLDLIAITDPTKANAAVRAARHIFDPGFPLNSALSTALYNLVTDPGFNFGLYDLSGFRVYANAGPNASQELTGFQTGFVQICKVAGVGVALNTPFTFTVPFAPLVPGFPYPAISVAAGAAPNGNCGVSIEVPVGLNQPVQETIPNGTTLSSVVSAPPSALANTNLTTGLMRVQVALDASVRLTFTNSIPPNNTDAFLKFCKVAGPGVTVGAISNFTVSGTAISVNVAAGAGPAGNCSDFFTVPAGLRIVTEAPAVGIALTSVTSVPANAITASNLGGGTATVNFVAGNQITLNFVNALNNLLQGFVQVCKAAEGVEVGVAYNFTVAGQPLVLNAGTVAQPNCSAPLQVTPGNVSVTETITPTILLTAVDALPAGSLVSSSLATGQVTVTVASGGITFVTFTNRPRSITPPLNPQTDGPYHLRYFANLNVGDSFINITNTGLNGAGTAAGTDANTTGAVCANVYTFEPGENMVSCCSCPVTPNGLVALSVRNDLLGNTFTPQVPNSVVVKLVASTPVAGSCLGSAAGINRGLVTSGILAWGTTLHAKPDGSYGSTETRFSTGTLSQTPGNLPGDISELTRLAQLCNFINANGSGFGICRTCRLGGLGSGRL